VLWLFTDAVRLLDPLAAARRLPRGLGGVVFRPEGLADGRTIGLALGRICRSQGLALSVARDFGLAHTLRGHGVAAGLHLRGGRPARWMPSTVPVLTASAHGRAELARARRAGAALVFLSPVFPTASHPGKPALGALRWAGLARRAGVAVAALGGVDERTVETLPRFCAGVGGINVFS
jgi:thiamine-phosphate pyrophosphorylase